jgi:hypothetical protein
MIYQNKTAKIIRVGYSFVRLWKEWRNTSEISQTQIGPHRAFRGKNVLTDQQMHIK